LSKRRTVLLMIRIATDLFAVGLAWFVAYLFRFHTFLEAPKGVPNALVYIKLTPFIIVIWAGVLTLTGFYKRTIKPRSAFLEGLDAIQSCGLATLSFIAFTYFYDEYRYSRITLLLFFLIHPWFLITGRSVIRKLLRYYRRRRPPRGVVVIGQREVQTVIFALPQSAYAYLESHIEEVTNQVPDVKVLPDIARYSKLGASIDVVLGIPVINIHASPMEGVGSVVKRGIDVAGALFALTVFSPALLVISFLVKRSSPGPILYRQKRMGLDGQTFDCLKFRSMPIDAEKGTGPVWAKSGENRATRIGSILRKYSLDELPQFINVLKGEMSLVGPRPERPIFVQDFRTKVPGYMIRHKVKAGITGWAQVNGWRGNTSIEKRIEYDLYYIQNWSVWLDIRILAMTVTEVFFSKNAY